MKGKTASKPCAPKGTQKIVGNNTMIKSSLPMKGKKG